MAGLMWSALQINPTRWLGWTQEIQKPLPLRRAHNVIGEGFAAKFYISSENQEITPDITI